MVSLSFRLLSNFNIFGFCCYYCFVYYFVSGKSTHLLRFQIDTIFFSHELAGSAVRTYVRTYTYKYNMLKYILCIYCRSRIFKRSKRLATKAIAMCLCEHSKNGLSSSNKNILSFISFICICICREAALPIKKIKNKPAYYKRMNEVQQRRVKLVRILLLLTIPTVR